jgi:hypothetical protein
MSDLKKSQGEKNRSNDLTESLSSEEIVRQHFQKKAEKAAAEESARKKEEDSQNTHF